MSKSKRRFSHTSLKAYRRCRQRYKWGYIDNLQPLPGKGLVKGSVGHETLADWYTHKDRDRAIKVASDKLAEFESEFEEQMDDEWELLSIVLERYFDYSEVEDKFETLAVEKKFELEIGGHDIIGYIDGVVRDSFGTIWLLEHKFQKQARTKHLNMDMQSSIYLWAARQMGYEARGVLYNIIRMGIKGIAESEPVVRLPVYRNNEGLEYIADEVAVQMQEMLNFHEGQFSAYRNQTPDCSWDCSFYTACLALNDNGRAESILNSYPKKEFKGDNKDDESD